ncbi:MAG: LysR family transcriptional regulator, partial [Mesorhizobium sp.]
MTYENRRSPQWTQHFLAIAETLSFSKAGETLGISRATVSAQLGELEKRLGIRLLQRTTMLHRVRLMLNRQRTQISNALRAHLSEFGVVAPIGRNGIEQLLVVINDENDARIPADARLCLRMLEAQLRVVKEQILENDRRVRASARETELGRRLMEIPGVGPLLASAFVATIADAHAFKSGRCLSAWIGLVPKQNSSCGFRREAGRHSDQTPAAI